MAAKGNVVRLKGQAAAGSRPRGSSARVQQGQTPTINGTGPVNPNLAANVAKHGGGGETIVNSRPRG